MAKNPPGKKERKKERAHLAGTTPGRWQLLQQTAAALHSSKTSTVLKSYTESKTEKHIHTDIQQYIPTHNNTYRHTTIHTDTNKQTRQDTYPLRLLLTILDTRDWRMLTIQTLDLASSSAFTKKPPRCSSTSRPDDAARSVLGVRPTATTKWSTDTCHQCTAHEHTMLCDTWTCAHNSSTDQC